jgi:hypothetical protein
MPFDHLPPTTCESPRPRREKLFREKRGIPLDREAKVRIMAYARGYNAKHRREGQHQGPITWAFFRVLKTLLWEFHNPAPAIAFRATRRLPRRRNAAGIPSMKPSKSWRPAASSIGSTASTKSSSEGSWQVIRVSNAYLFRDPLAMCNIIRKL